MVSYNYGFFVFNNVLLDYKRVAASFIISCLSLTELPSIMIFVLIRLQICWRRRVCEAGLFICGYHPSSETQKAEERWELVYLTTFWYPVVFFSFVEPCRLILSRCAWRLSSSL